MKPSGIPEDVKVDEPVVVSEEKPEKKPVKGKKSTEQKEKPEEKESIKDMEVKLIKVQSDYRGIIVTKFGSFDFGETGLIEVTENVARYLSKLKGYKVV